MIKEEKDVIKCANIMMGHTGSGLSLMIQHSSNLKQALRLFKEREEYDQLMGIERSCVTLDLTLKQCAVCKEDYMANSIIHIDHTCEVPALYKGKSGVILHKYNAGMHLSRADVVALIPEFIKIAQQTP